MLVVSVELDVDPSELVVSVSVTLDPDASI